GPFVQSRAKALAERLIREADDDEQRIRRAFLLCFSREADADEAKMAAAFLEQGKNLAGDEDAGGDGQQPRRRLLAAYCQALLSTAEFRNLD
ncbi:MAG: hypothetical protein WD403_14465, partial [Pirellulales bacterium]